MILIIMLNVNLRAKLAIYIGEREETDCCSPDYNWHHTFLMLVDETTCPVTILQQLHFDADPDNDYSLVPIALEGTSNPNQYPERFKNVSVFPVLGGNFADILNIWNDALSYSFYLKHMGIPFDTTGYKFVEDAVNCRAGVIATLNSIGIDYARGYYAGNAGTSCKIIPLNKGFFEASKSNTESVLARNERIMTSLGAQFYKDRYVGPLSDQLYVIAP